LPRRPRPRQVRSTQRVAVAARIASASRPPLPGAVTAGGAACPARHYSAPAPTHSTHPRANSWFPRVRSATRSTRTSEIDCTDEADLRSFSAFDLRDHVGPRFVNGCAYGDSQSQVERGGIANEWPRAVRKF